MAQRNLVVAGSFRDETCRRVTEGSAAAGVQPDFHPRCDAAREAMSGADPLAIVVRMDAPGASDLCAHVRTQSRLADVPIFGVSPDATDIAFTELFSWGGDDMVSLWSPHPLARRLRALLSRTPRPAAGGGEGQGGAIVAGADPRWRSVMGRALYAGGFSVRFATSETELAADGAGPGVRLVVAADDVAPDGAAACAARARATGAEAAWVVVSPPKRIAASLATVAGLTRVSVADGYAPPENVLFLANELLARRGQDQRTSARLLYGTTVAFRAAGRDEDEIGFSYNVSAGGVYVRSLAPLDQGQEVWLEMFAPRAERHLRLAGTVAWKRLFGSGERATVPAGFGVKITAGLGGDLERWQAGYDAFAESLLGRRVPPATTPEV
jgi:hypothetical protein